MSFLKRLSKQVPQIPEQKKSSRCAGVKLGNEH